MTTTLAGARRPTFRESLVKRVEAANDRLFRAASHLLEVDGKAIRPGCVRLVGRAANPDAELTEAHERLAEAVELLHVGSLIHDDILDEAELRRGVPSVHITYGSKAAVLAGDYLLSRSCGLIASLGHHELNRRMAEVLAGLCEGEYLQDEQLWDLDVTLEAYLERMALKTSGPFELACEGAVILSGGPRELVEHGRRFGFHLGRLFQMLDDLLDWSSTAQVLGKPVGQDLVAGSLTLPAIAALQDPVVGPQLRTQLTPFPKEVRPELKALLFRSNGFRKALQWVQEEADRARECLVDTFPPSEGKEELLGYLERLIDQASQLVPFDDRTELERAAHAV
jgi:all-trans-nonaprenyl-diphosphate synthase